MVSSAEVPNQFVLRWNGVKSKSLTTHHEHNNTKRTSSSSSGSGSKLRSACDSCRVARVRCRGGNPCQRCRGHGSHCQYSPSLRNGRWKANRSRDSLSPSLTSNPPSRQDSAHEDLQSPQLTAVELAKSGDGSSETPSLVTSNTSSSHRNEIEVSQPPHLSVSSSFGADSSAQVRMKNKY